MKVSFCYKMHFFLLIRKLGAFLHIFEALFFGLPLLNAQGLFPELENIAAYKPIYTDPPDATCGIPKRSVFCQSDVNLQSIQTCTQRLCIQDCPYGVAAPGFRQLLKDDLGICVRKDKMDLRPMSSNNSNSFIFYDHKDCFVAASPLRIGSSFTLTVWLKPEQDGEMCVIEKSADGQIVFKLTISEKETVFYYRTVNGLQPPIKVMTLGRFPVKKWIHLSVQVHYTKVGFFINGPEEDLTPFDARFLIDPVYEPATENFLTIGQSINGSDQFIGRMQDFRLYQEALTNREILEVFSEKFLHVPIQSECRCPSSHPRLHPLEGRSCLPNGVYNKTKDKVLRLNRDAHPVSYMNDNDLQTTWISSVLSASDFDKGLNITVDLTNGQYQIFYVTVQFYSPMPTALKAQRKKNRNSPWEDWQYFASDCTDFGMDNNGFLEHSDSANCLQFPRDTPYSNGNVTLSLLTPEPNHRPGYNDFYKTRDLQEFVKASLVRIQLTGQYHTVESNVSLRHRYYGIREITISGRCNCHGHANSCDTSVSPYKCLCDTKSFTDGDNCDRCLPLFNNKPFHQGDHVNAYNCVPCRCNNHSSSCHYNTNADPHPHDHEQGGGGVCDYCLHSTAGSNCEVCKIFFYRKFGADPSAIDVCQPCDCNEAGTADKSQNCEKLGGQCRCKLNIGGRRCDQCNDGFYHLQESNPNGCQPCHCNISGTINGNPSCHQNTGQCQCKTNVIGPRCDRCKLGFKQDTLGRESCIQCTCSPYGAINQFCNPASGQCKCRENVSGLDCDTCIDNYYGLDADGCKPCKCHMEGIIPGTLCDAVTGQCVCQPNVGGRQCDECLEGYYKFTQNGSMSCPPCRCDRSGAINASQSCDQLTGQCVCKASVTGRQCNICIDRTYNLSSGNIWGCQDCDCDLNGTLPGSTCDRINGQCQCLPNYQGRRCSRCNPGFHFSSDSNNMGCVPCFCHLQGSINATCDDINGQCYCRDSSVSGLKCDRCREKFYGFDTDTGRCQHCSCHTAGAVNTSCHAITGQCFCKEFVSGITCSHCVEDSSSLDVDNPYGCSSTPSQQPPPRGHIVNSTTIMLTWSPPDSPNTNWIDYVLYRDGLGIYQCTDYYPYSIQSYMDKSLLPYTTFTYHINARNVHGSVSSTKVTYQTSAGPPSGEIELSLVYPVSLYSASLNWTIIPQVLGPVETFRLIYTSQGPSEMSIAYEGLDTQVTVHNLTPFTKYNFSVHACNSEGCLQSLPITVVTAQAPPAGQGPPVVQNSSATDLYLQWSPPLQPNGVIIRHELYMRGLHQTIERRVFHASGWLNPQPVVGSKNENALMPPITHAVITNLEPNTEYEFCIVTTNMAGSVASEWVVYKTAESEPIYMSPPSLTPLSSNSLNVSWVRPSNNVARGDITGYTINMVPKDQLEISATRRASSEVIYVAESHEVYYEVSGLEAYHDYAFTVTLCNKIGCVTSIPALGKTLASAPKELKPPLVEGINSTVMKISWSAPVRLNGPSPVYQLERIEPSLTIQDKTTFIKGVRFPGHGYLKFSPSSLPENTYFTGIKIQFRTKEAEGLILCAVSAGTQEEYIVLQIRNGRPYFLFDPQDSAVAVTPTNDDNRLYNDNQWHQIIVTRNQASGRLTVDGKYSGFASATGSSTVIGENTGVLVGGLPANFSVKRKDIGNTKIIQKSFVGCLGDIFIQKSDSQKEWQLLDWDTAEERSNVFEKWEGCPESVEEGAHFLGFGFIELAPSVFPGGADIEISFMLKTDQLRGLLLFIYNTDGSDYILVQLDSGILTLNYKSNSSLIQVNLWAGLSYCDGRWNHMLLRKEGGHFCVQLNNLIEQMVEPEVLEIKVNSPVFIGGVPESVQNLFPELNMQQGFGGCLKDISFIQDVVVNIASESNSAVRVSLDGCPSSDRSVNCRGNDSTIIYRGEEETVHDHRVPPFTEYLYRVIASNDGGSGDSPWSRGRSKAAFPPNGQIPLKVLQISGSSAEVTWDRPTGVRGIIEQYILTAEPENNPSISTTQAVYLDANQINGTLRGLVPFTKYMVTLSVCTLSGCSENSHVLNITTLQEAPSDVQSPTGKCFHSSIHLDWFPPRNPNGIITGYILYMDEVQIHTGKGTGYNVSGLAAFTTHLFLLSACTMVGCTNSSRVTLTTAQLPPEYVAPPLLRVLDTTKIHVQWEEPDMVNGILERYMLHISESNSTGWNTIYNCTELFLDYTIQGLTPGTNYFIKLSACSGGGCTESDITEASTVESLPEGIGTLSIQSHSPGSFNISWLKPQHPNGVITSYGLYMDGILMQNSSRLSYFVDGLAPWSKRSFRLQACNVKGCALGEKFEAYTQESEPEGNVSVNVHTNGPKDVQLKWQGPEKHNGHITYYVIFTGLFYEKKGDDNHSITNSSRILYQSQEKDEWVLVDGLVPFSRYTVRVNASNGQGHVTSAPIIISMPPGAPDGVLPPRLSSANPTSLQVVWSSPVRNNAPGLPNYRLQMRLTNPTNKITDVFSGPSASFIYTIKNLQPYTTYELRIIASNAYGYTYSKWTNVSTEQDKPGSIDPPRLSHVKSRSITITWQQPTKPNGIITHYNIYQFGSLEITVPANTSSHTFHDLTPYTSYIYQLEGCTSAGCSLSKESNVIETLPDAPSDVLPPDLHSDNPTSVLIRWKPPLHPNGLIESFSIERRLKGTEQVDIIVTVPGNHQMQYTDQASDLNPWKTYEYRMVATTVNGGTNYSDWVEVTTRPSRPVGVQPPEVTILGPYTAKVTWNPPLRPNGDILSYEIRMPEPRIVLTDPTVLSYIRTNLIPYTNYSVCIVACSGGALYHGGCTESLPTYVTTQSAPPEGIRPLSVIPVSETFIAISWQPPLRPNGPDIRYELLRRTILQPLTSNPPEDLNLWQNIYSGTQWFCEDKGLSRYTFYEYKLIVYNSVGYTSSPEVLSTTLPGPPLRGSDLIVKAVNHTAIEAFWTKPTIQDLQGAVDHYTVILKSTKYDKSLIFHADVNQAVIGGLHPNTEYHLYVEVSNGPHSISSGWEHVSTLDGEPEGLLPPEVVVINSTAVRVIWSSPSNPNGVVTEYSIHVNNKVYKTESKTPYVFILGDLGPYRVYSIQVEVCTVYSCIKSNATQVATVEGSPKMITSPKITNVTTRSAEIVWCPPEEPNGIILGYELRRKHTYPCTSMDKNGHLCLFIKCKKGEDICGQKCYNPQRQVCCRDVLHDRKDGYECCEQDYVASMANASQICCAGQVYGVKSEHQCCGGYYTELHAGEVCCYDKTQNRVSIGNGDSCCGKNPFSTSGLQICCGESLYDGFTQRCCGGRIMPRDFICCGDEQEGSLYRPLLGMSCCGQDFVNVSDTTCCSGPNGQFKAHLKLNNGIPLKCCETELIIEEEECCKGIGYNPVTHVCSDKPSTESFITEESCSSAPVCPVSSSDAAYCGQCHFNSSSDSCFSARGVITGNRIAVEDDHVCWTDEETIYTTRQYFFTDSGLHPFTSYQYRIATWNSFGHSISDVSRVATNQDIPQGLSPPRWTIADKREGVISLSWQEPRKLNGIVYYVLLRDGVERYKGTEKRYEDQGGIAPYKEYTYQLRACTAAGCLHSAKVTAAIKQGVPENISPPVIVTVNSTALLLSWASPKKPNGEIKEYQIHQVGKGIIYVSSSGKKQFTVSDLQPYTKYTFFLTVCTSVGCNSSEMASGYTSQDPPQGVWLDPHHVTINSSALELYWREPEKPNGMISEYRLIRNGTVISTRSGEYLNYTDVGLQPNSSYFYQLEAQNEAGSSISHVYVVETPIETPQEIPVPYNITVLGPYSAFVAWDDPGVCDPSIPLEFNVLLNAGRSDAQIHSAGEKRFIIFEDLIPGAEFSLRLQACQHGSCGVGSPLSMVTTEAAPEGLDPPILFAIGQHAIKITWKEPTKPNGIITRYIIHRFLSGGHGNVTAVPLPGGSLEYIDTSEDLQPYTHYEYSITAQNSEGFLQSSWSIVRTVEAAPEDLDPPTAEVTSAYSVLLNWTAPSRPHGIIRQYLIMYQESTSDLTPATFSGSALTVPGTTYQAEVFGLRPSSLYHICIKATNSAGTVSSTWISIKTWEAAPDALNFTVDKTENGRALLLRWSQPARTNGVLVMYNVYSDGNLEYSGLSQQYLFSRLEPFTVYTLVLESCTAAGCTQTFPYRVQTEEASPGSQLPPQIKLLNATHIQLNWSPPVQPNGKVIKYDIIKRSTQENALGTRKNLAESVVFSEVNMEPMVFTYTDGGLKPWTDYEYKVRAWNSVGYTDSTWTLGQTSQAAPTFILPPKLFYGTQNPNHIIIQWTKPEEDNGKILYYKLQKNNITLPFNFDYATLNYTDDDLFPYSEYTYSIVACTLGGCTISDPTHMRTLEGPPGALNPPRIEALSATEVNVSWSPPPIQNGEITKYIAKIDNETCFAGTRLSIVISNLQPFTSYNISLVACTNGGCTNSSNTLVRTKEAPPSHIREPSFTVTSAQSIKISWQSPDKPNGEITNYELRRDGQLTYVGLETHYHDFGLEPGTEYSYTIQASNSQGSCISAPANMKTHSSSPSGMEAPRLHGKSAQEILISWKAPLKPNGHILNYTLHVHHPAEMKAIQYTFNSSYISQNDHSFVIKDLKPYTQYEARVEACTLLGCAVSEWVTGHTLDALPESQPAPIIDVQKNNQAPLLAWNGPKNPNGKIIRYDVYRRRIKEIMTTDLVFNGSALSFQDADLLPYTEYEYQVWAVNSAGRTASSWVHCRTGPAAPEGLLAPIFHKVSSTLAVANITPPTKPNGEVILYRLFYRNDMGEDTVVSEGTSNQQTIHGLKPFTNVSIGVEACTCLTCCSKGPVSRLTTLSASPSHQRPPHITHKTSRAVSLQWSAPGSPNGIIQRYEVHTQETCPQSDQTVGVSCAEGELEMKYSGEEESCEVLALRPFTTYNLRVTCYNAEGSTSSDWVKSTTLKEKPVYKTNFYVLSNVTTIFLDWKQSFQLNGQLKEFVLTERGQRVYSGLDSSVHIQKTTDKTFYFQVKCTTDMGSVSTPIVKYSSATGLAPEQSNPSTKNGMDARGNVIYTELWFILLMASLALVLLAILLSLILQRKLTKQPFPRERPPLVPLQQRMSPASAYSESDTYAKWSVSGSQQPLLKCPVSQVSNPPMCVENNPEKSDLVADVSGSSNRITLKSYTMHLEGISDIKISGVESHTSRNAMLVRKTSQSQISHSFSENSLYRSASQLIASHDKKSIVDSSIWDSVIQGHDSGMFMDDEDLISTIKSFSTVTKQHTAFTDTPL
ncbi:usherin [Rhinoderma darwinii]|uniref:usherin n=1 Tax=Rhinoderma darwinii TaxID=43563 RepID=UPI003F66DE5A